MDAVQPATKCLVCDGEVEPGYVVDKGDADWYAHLQEWWSGVPVRKFFGALRRPKIVRKVVTCRCVECGFLMAYAP